MLLKCSDCQQYLPVDSFGPDKSKKRGYNYRCKSCATHQSREWEKSEKGRLYRKSMLPNKRQYMNLRYQIDPDYRARKYEYRRSENAKLSVKRFRQTPHGRAQYIKIKKKYQSSHKAKFLKRLVRIRRRTLLKRKGIAATLTSSEWQQILVRYGNRCVYCGSHERLTMDHYIPVSKGGTHTKENVVPACLDCNRHKNARDPHRLF